MRYGKLSSFQTGVAVAVFSLRSRHSVGIGEFLDLVPFGDFAHKAGFDLLQLLPVNDTGEESSPYSARSAFALNPAYIRLQNIPGAAPHLAEIEKAKEHFESLPQMPYHEVARFKRYVLRKIYQDSAHSIAKEPSLSQWISENDWVKSYAVYCVLKARNGESSWQSWSEFRDPTPAQLKSLWTKNAQECLFEAWMQMMAEQQFSTAIESLEHQGVKLKGDIPILINEDSADVWADRSFFDLSKRAGAPPDMFSYSGQNWGFPTYRWEALAQDNYGWWRRRLRQAAKFYHAYRIDHVLGFFRIWTVPSTEVTGIMGHFQPAHPVTRHRLDIAAIQQGTIDYLTYPNFGVEYLHGLFGAQTQRVLAVYFKSIGNARYQLRESLLNEQAIVSLAEEQTIKDSLLQVYWNRVFLPGSNGQEYWPFWYWYNAPVFHTLPSHEQAALRGILEENEISQEPLWRENGLKLLQVMAEETDMLVCAEDLGVIPDCVPAVLQSLGILSLRIERWSRDWKAAGQPYISPRDYPRLSVCTTSCHDSSTLAGLWQESDFDRQHYWESIGAGGQAPARIGPAEAKLILSHLFHGNSLLAIPALQDYLSLQPAFAERDPALDRINVPGTVGSHNWIWRMPMSAESLAKDSALVKSIRQLVDIRKQRKIS